MRDRTIPPGTTRRKVYGGKRYVCDPIYALDVFGKPTTLINPGCGRGFIYSGSCPYCGNRLT